MIPRYCTCHIYMYLYIRLYRFTSAALGVGVLPGNLVEGVVDQHHRVRLGFARYDEGKSQRDFIRAQCLAIHAKKNPFHQTSSLTPHGKRRAHCTRKDGSEHVISSDSGHLMVLKLQLSQCHSNAACYTKCTYGKNVTHELAVRSG